MANLDDIDRRLLGELQDEGRITNVELAHRVGLTAPPCLRRVRALEEEGVIKGYHADLDPSKLGFSITVFAMVMFLFLVLAPIAVMVALLIALFIPQPHRWRRRGYLISRYIAEWCMLDVFALAMVLYLSEQTNFVKLDIKEGIWFLFGSVLIFTLAINWAEHVMYRAIRRREDVALKKVTSHLSHKQSE